jgi:transcriptional regulator of acetoin/glycerol metabolism
MSDGEKLDDVLRAHVLKVIGRYANLTLAAIALGMDRRTLYRWLKKWDIDPEKARQSRMN